MNLMQKLKQQFYNEGKWGNTSNLRPKIGRTRTLHIYVRWNLFIALGLLDNYLEKTTCIKLTVLLDSYKTSPHTLPSQKSL